MHFVFWFPSIISSFCQPQTRLLLHFLIWRSGHKHTWTWHDSFCRHFAMIRRICTEVEVPDTTGERACTVRTSEALGRCVWGKQISRVAFLKTYFYWCLFYLLSCFSHLFLTWWLYDFSVLFFLPLWSTLRGGFFSKRAPRIKIIIIVIIRFCTQWQTEQHNKSNVYREAI